MEMEQVRAVVTVPIEFVRPMDADRTAEEVAIAIAMGDTVPAGVGVVIREREEVGAEPLWLMAEGVSANAWQSVLRHLWPYSEAHPIEGWRADFAASPCQEDYGHADYASSADAEAYRTCSRRTLVWDAVTERLWVSDPESVRLRVRLEKVLYRRFRVVAGGPRHHSAYGLGGRWELPCGRETDLAEIPRQILSYEELSGPEREMSRLLASNRRLAEKAATLALEQQWVAARMAELAALLAEREDE